MINVKTDLGAVGDGVTDDSASFNAAAAASGAVYVPEGKYHLPSGVTFTSKSVFLTGDGCGNTELRFGSVPIGIRIDNSLTFSPVEIRDMSIATTNPLGGTAIDIEWPETFDGRLIHKGTLSGLQISGVNNMTQGWSKGIRYKQGCFVTIKDCGILGRDTNGNDDLSQVAKTSSQIGIEWLGGVFPVDIRVKDSFINCWDRGFEASGAPEGLMFHHDTFLYCRIAIKAQPTTFSPGLPKLGGLSAAFRPMLQVSDCHASVYQSAVYANGMVQSNIHDNLFYATNLGAQDANLIDILNAGGMQVFNNQLYSFATQRGVNGIVLQVVNGDSEVVHNKLGPMNCGIWFKSSVSNVVEAFNTFTTPYSVMAVYDQGTGNLHKVY
jgi:hypothetical protein